jgi:hypothetical protein
MRGPHLGRRDRVKPLANPTRCCPSTEGGAAMAEYGLFIGWGQPRTGKEIASIKVFEEAVALVDRLKAAGDIEGADYALLGYHGGDLNGFMLLRGEPEQLARVGMTPEFRAVTMRAATCLEHVGIVQAFVGTGVMRSLGSWREAIDDLI